MASISAKTDDDRAFWKAYLPWQSKASDADLDLLQRSLTTLQQDRLTLSGAMRLALTNDDLRQGLPTTLVRHLQHARWPVALEAPPHLRPSSALPSTSVVATPPQGAAPLPL